MKCPGCNNEVRDYQMICHYCGYLFDSYFEELYDDIVGKIIYPMIIEENINKYSNIPIKTYKTKGNKSEIIFKNISSNCISQNVSNILSPEEFTINFYKQNGYYAFFAENNYWITLFSMIYEYEDFIKYSFTYEAISENRLTNQDIIDKIDFNSIKNIPNITNHIINAYFKNIQSRVPPNEIYNYDDYYCALRNDFKVGEFIVASSYLTKDQLKLIFERMGDDFKYYPYGFPDLIVYNEDEFFFVEVKSKNDNPSFKQIQWHKYLVEVVGIDVVLFMIDKSDDQVSSIKKSYDIELKDSKKRKTEFKESNKKISINWNDDSLKQLMCHVSNDKFNKLIYLRRAYTMRHEKYVVNDYTYLTPDDFGDIDEWNNYREIRLAKRNDFIFEKAKELYCSYSFEDFTPSQKQLDRNKKAKLFENNGEYSKAVNLYMMNVIEKTGSPTTYKRLINILNRFDRFYDVVKLMDIAIPIFITLNDKTNSLRFIAQRFAAMNKNKGVYSSDTISSDTLKSNQKKKDSKQTDLSSYFN